MGELTLVVALALSVAAPGPVAAASLDEVMKERASTHQAAAESQATIDAVADDTDALASEYRRTLEQSRALRVYNRQVEELLASQEKEMASLQKQIEEVTVVGREVIPLMLRMIDTLDAFVELDLPFLREERRSRAANLRALMERADVSISEKYRRILEAYQIESEYGRTIEAYRATLEIDGASRTVDFLRVGRVALLYQTLDAQESGMWDSEARKWTALSGGYRSSIREGLRMARKQVAPDLVRVPVPVAQEMAQ